MTDKRNIHASSESSVTKVRGKDPKESLPQKDSRDDEQEERGKEFLKAYFSSESPDSSSLTASLLAQVSAEDPSVAASLGLLYDYYVQNENSPTSPTSENDSGSNTIPSVMDHEDVTIVSSNVGEVKRRNEKDRVSQAGSGRQRSLSHTSTPTTVEAYKTVVKQQSSQPDCDKKSQDQSCVVRSTVSATNVTDIIPIVVRNPSETFNSYYDSSSKPQTLFAAKEKYCFILEAPPSIIQRQGEDTLTYLNKGQFYCVHFEANRSQFSGSGSTPVKSVLHLVFRDEKDQNVELQHWRYWHTQQANPQQRAFDIDRKSCQNIEEHIDDIAYNAAAFYWNTNNNAKIIIRMNCLSTDFSPQKGVKGIPLHIQIDTYDDFGSDAEPVHRSFCQTKIFRDKGAERKNKDESKSAEKRLQKLMKQGNAGFEDSPASKFSSSLFQKQSKFTKLSPTTPLGPKPVLFSPTECFTLSDTTLTSNTFFHTVRENENKRRLQASLDIAKDELADLEFIPRNKAQRVQRPPQPVVTIYVKKEEERVYNALMLDSFGVNDLREAVAQKYDIPSDMIKAVYKKTKKGILVNMDDRMVEQFVDEDDFIIQIEFDNQLGHFELTLLY